METNNPKSEFINDLVIAMCMAKAAPRDKNGKFLVDIAKSTNVGFFYIFLN